MFPRQQQFSWTLQALISTQATIIKNEQGRRTDDPGSDEAKDQMDEMGFKYIPWQGKIIPYDSKKVMEYKFEKK